MTDNRTATVSERRRGLRPLAGNLLLAGAAVLAGLVVCELLLRLLGVSYPVYVWTHPVRGVAHIPGAKSVRQYAGHSWIEINSDGWGEDPRPHSTHPPALFGLRYSAIHSSKLSKSLSSRRWER